MFTIFLSIVFTTCILAIPAPTRINQWNKYKEDKTLSRFHSTLLNETILPFLNECDINEMRKPKDIIFVCSRYIDAILQLNNTNYDVSIPTVLKVLNQTNVTGTFCEEKHTFPSRKYLLDIPERDFNNLAVCGKLCLEDDAITPKPICRFLTWMGDELKTASTSEIKHVSNAAKPDVVNESASAKIPQEDFPKMQTFPNSTFDVQSKSTEPAKAAELVPEKIVPKTPKLVTKAPQVKRPVEVPIENKFPVEKKSPDVNKTPIQTSEPVVEKQPVENKEQTEDKQPIEEDNKQTNPIETAVDPRNPQKEETQAQEDVKDETPLATINSSAQETIKIPETSKNKQDTIDSENIDTEEDGDENEMDYQNVKPDKIEVVNPDNELNQSSKQEIINNEILSSLNNNKKIDPFHEQSGSNFFTYFLVAMFLCIAMYVAYHNKSKILALVLEGRRGDKGRNGRRKHTAAYRKLDSNLEEAITSSARGRTTQIIY